jgi:hypothetical protein
MTHYFDSVAFGNIEGVNTLFGASVDIPTSFFKSGYSNLYNISVGKVTGLELASLAVGPSPTAPLSQVLLGASSFTGVHNQNGSLVVAGHTELTGTSMDCTTATASFNTGHFNVASGKAAITASKVDIEGLKVSISAEPLGPLGGLTIGGEDWFSKVKFWDSKKQFDIPHPTKNGWRLRHVCIEGPTADVYVRGKLKGSNVIELPEYWKNLVDPETITVNLTPIAAHQELFVDKIEWGTRILIKNNSGSTINCYYTVYGERADTGKNIPEYEGTYDDYPGDNREYTSSGTAICNPNNEESANFSKSSLFDKIDSTNNPYQIYYPYNTTT